MTAAPMFAGGVFLCPEVCEIVDKADIMWYYIII